MQIINRYAVGLPLAGAVTIALTLSMAAMIKAEFQVSETLESFDFNINPNVEDIDVHISPDLEPELIEVETPPAPPVLDDGKTKFVDKPAPVTPPSPKPMDLTFKIAGPLILPIDSNPQPTVRVPPSMPARATRSGHCNVLFNVSAQGIPYDVQTTDCTDQIFKKPTLRSVIKWKYKPRIQNGQAVAMQGLTNRVVYRLTDEKGQIIPE